MKRSNGKPNGNGGNSLSTKREQTASRIIQALKETKGLLTQAAQNAGVSYTTITRYVADFPSVSEAVHEAKEGMVDLAESKLFNAIDKGEAWAICFYLKTQAKHRGYTERHEVTGEDGKPIKTEIRVVSEAAKDLTEKIISGEGTS